MSLNIFIYIFADKYNTNILTPKNHVFLCLKKLLASVVKNSILDLSSISLPSNQ
nr:MAG TPA: hypothetical protein [Bacteriophage sp.]